MEDLHKEFIPYELALRMKVLGFDEPCITFYPVNLTQPLIGDYATLGLNGKYSSIKDGYRNSVCLNQLWKKRYKQDYANVAAPTFSQAFRWFREKYGLSKTIDDFYSDGKLRFDYSIRKIGSQEDNPKGIFVSYEDAQQACLEEMIQIIEQDGKDKSET
jgi:hypothetical protein